MKTTRALKIVAMFPLGFMVLVLMIFGVGEAVDGDLGGLMHLVQVAVVGTVVWLAWKRPLWGGLLLILGAVLQAATFGRLFANAGASAIVAPLVILFLPQMFSGLLLLIADWLERQPQQRA